MADSYLSQVRAGDWGHNSRMKFDGFECGSCKETGSTPLYGSCPAKIAVFALERAIEEIERLATERCFCCRSEDRPAVPLFLEHRLYKHGSPEHSRICLAQPEQRRLAELREELAALLKQPEATKA